MQLVEHGRLADPLDVAIEQTVELLEKFSIPLYRMKDKRRPEQIGTGFFVRAAEKTYLVSAAHVLDMAKSNEMFFYATPQVIRPLTGRLLRSKGEFDRKNDLVDIGVLELSGKSVPPYPEVDKHPMDISYLQPGLRPRTGKHYVMIGFPATKSRLDPTRRETTVQAYAFRNSPLDEDSYAAHGLDPNNHIALKLNLKQGVGPNQEKLHFPKPQGMSGSPIVVLYDENLEDQSRVFPIVGVATTYRKSKQLLFGTDVRYVIDAIEHATSQRSSG